MNSPRFSRLICLFALAAASCFSPLAVAQENSLEIETKWHGFEKVEFESSGRRAYIVVPKKTADGTPWVWRARFPDFHFEMDVELLERGFHIAYVDVAGMFGSPRAMEIADAFYEHLTADRDFSAKPVLEGVSRGGLFVYNWAVRNPDKVACIYCDTPVCDIKSWPAGTGVGIGHEPTWKNCQKAYDMTEEQALAFRGNPVDHAREIAASNIPLMHIVSESDRVVPPGENSYLLRSRLEAFGGKMEVISVAKGTEQSKGHHFTHPDPERVVNFIIKHTIQIPQRIQLLTGSKRAIFLGDSLTYQGGYVAIFETWIQTQDFETSPSVINVGLPSETVSGLSEKGHAGGRFPRPDLAERLDRVLAETQPDLVFACYGINCGIYQPFDDARFAAYKNGVNNLHAKVEAVGAHLIWITPAIYDNQSAKRESTYDSVLNTYSQWLVSHREQGWHVIDLHSAMAKEIRLRRQTKPEFTFQTDGVHTNAEGEWYMASRIINWFGDTNAANENTFGNFLAASGTAEEVAKKVKQRMAILRAAYLSETGHRRPGIAAGLPLEEAAKKASELTAEIRELRK